MRKTWDAFFELLHSCKDTAEPCPPCGTAHQPALCRVMQVTLDATSAANPAFPIILAGGHLDSSERPHSQQPAWPHSGGRRACRT